MFCIILTGLCMPFGASPALIKSSSPLFRRGLLIAFCVAGIPVLLFGQLSVDPVPQTLRQYVENPSQPYEQAIEFYEQGLYIEALQLLDALSVFAETEDQAEAAAAFAVRIRFQLDPLESAPLIRAFSRHYPRSPFGLELNRELGHRLWKTAQNHTSSPSVSVQRGYEAFTEARSFPGDNQAYAQLIYWQAEASTDMGKNDQARTHYIELADLYPADEHAPNALYAAGRLHLTDEQFSQAAAVFERLRKDYEFHPITRRIGTALGESYYQQREFARAAKAFIDAIPYLDGEEIDKAVYLAAESFNAEGNYKDATQYYLQFINRTKGKPSERLAHFGLGWVYHKQSIYHWAARSFGIAAGYPEQLPSRIVSSDELNPLTRETISEGDVDEFNRKALYYTAVNAKLSNRYDLAIQRFREFAIRYTGALYDGGMFIGGGYRPGVFAEEGAFEHAVTAFEMGLFAEAIEVLTPIVRNLDQMKRPGELLTFLGEVYFANGEYTSALQAFEMAESMTTLDPEVKIQARFQKAWVQYSNQAYVQAQPLFESVARQNPSSPLAAEALFWSADSYFQTRSYGPSAQQFAEFIRRFPDHEFIGAASYALAWSHFMAGEFEQVIDPMTLFLQRYDPPPIALFPYDTDARLRLGDAFFALGRYEQAIETYQMVYGAEPAGDYAMFQVANSMYRMGRLEEAVGEFKKLLRIYPFTFVREQALYNIGYIYLTAGQYDMAVTEFENLINRVPDPEWAARAQFAIGDAYYNSGKYVESVQAYETVLQKYPRSGYVIEAINGIQYAQLSAGEDDNSTQILQQFLDSHPSTSTADRLRFRKAENRLQSGDYTGAVAEFQDYIRITNQTERLPDAWSNIADARMRLENPQGAQQAWLRIVEEFPESEQAAFALASLGRVSFELREFEKSLDYFTQLEAKGSRYIQESGVGKGRALLELGQTDPAETEFKRVLEINEGNSAARNGMARVAITRQEYDQAREILLPVASQGISETGAEAQFLIGQSFRLEGRNEEALTAFSNVQVLHEAFGEWVGQALYEMAAIHILEGRPGDARELLKDLIENYNGTVAANQAKNLLESVD